MLKSNTRGCRRLPWSRVFKVPAFFKWKIKAYLPGASFWMATVALSVILISSWLLPPILGRLNGCSFLLWFFSCSFRFLWPKLFFTSPGYFQILNHILYFWVLSPNASSLFFNCGEWLPQLSKVKDGNLTLLLMAMGFSNQFIGNENFMPYRDKTV